MAKKDTEIDEDYLLASIGDRKEGRSSPIQEKKEIDEKEEPRRTKEVVSNKRGKHNSNNEDYEELFLCRNEIRQRQGAYISHSVYQTIMQIVKQIGGNDVSVGGYIDNVLKHHLLRYKDEINALYRKDRTDLID